MRRNGFTLIEVLVAMAILAIAMAALTRASGDSTANAAYLRDRTIGMWVAENRLTDLQVSSDWIGIGTTNGTEQLAGHVWHWRTITKRIADPTTQEYLRAVRIEVRVNADQQAPSAVLEGFVGNPKYKS